MPEASAVCGQLIHSLFNTVLSGKCHFRIDQGPFKKYQCLQGPDLDLLKLSWHVVNSVMDSLQNTEVLVRK